MADITDLKDITYPTDPVVNGTRSSAESWNPRLNSIKESVEILNDVATAPVIILAVPDASPAPKHCAMVQLLGVRVVGIKISPLVNADEAIH